MKFLSTLAFGFSTIAAMIAALLSFGFQVKVESPISPQQVAKEQQLSQCSGALTQAQQMVADANSKISSLEVRLRDAALVADQTAARLSTELTQRVQVANERIALAGTSTTLVTGIGLGVLMFPLGFLAGRYRRNQGIPLLTARMPEPIVVEAVREPVGALPLFNNPRRSRTHAQTGPVR